MRDTMWAGRVQKMLNDAGIPKGMKAILEERGINTSRMKADDMRAVLSFHDDFVNEKTIVEHFITDKSHTGLFLPKFHCKLNPIFFTRIARLLVHSLSQVLGQQLNFNYIFIFYTIFEKILIQIMYSHFCPCSRCIPV